MELTLATNNGDLGGGEVMLFNIARTARALGHQVTIVGPASPSEIVEAAQDEGFDTVTLPATTRQAYMAQLRVWDKGQRRGILWCNGLLPSVATVGHKNRIVHLHQLPVARQKMMAKLATKRTLRVLVPSHFVASALPSATVFYNWVEPVYRSSLPERGNRPLRVGFLGRPSPAKGTPALAEALHRIDREAPGAVRFVLGGTAKFVDEADRKTVQESLAPIEHFTEQLGWVAPQEFFNRIDLLVVPSEVKESFGLVAAEAMSAGVPVLVSDAGALPEVLGDNYPYVFPAGDSEALASTLSTVAEEIRTDSPLLEDTVQKSQWRWYENFSPEAGKARLRELLEEIDNEG